MFEHSSPHAAGVVIVTDFDGRDFVNDTKQCPHCGAHWIIQRGSGRPHVFCQRCMADTCSKPECLRQCYPEEKRMDDIEKHGRLIWPD